MSEAVKGWFISRKEYLALSCLNCCAGMANSVHPDQTAPSEAVGSGSTLFALACLSKYVVLTLYLDWLQSPMTIFILIILFDTFIKIQPVLYHDYKGWSLLILLSD